MAILNGTSGDDVINGTADGDTIEGLAGADELQGLGGGDTLRGGDDNDRLWGGEGHDTLEGGGGNDIINDHYGNDLLDGGEGDDHLESLYGGDDILRGGGGNDDIVLDHVEADHVQVDAGADNDRLSFSSYYAADDYVFDMGTGDDSIRVATLIGSVRITLGEGRDIVELSEFFAGSVGQGGSAVVGDFTPGDSGDRVEFLELIARVLPNWDHSLNPFATGHARLLQSGADSLLQLDTDGGGDGYVTVLTFKNVSAAAFTAWNLDGFPTDGTIPAGQTLTGTAGFDILKGAAGADRIEGLEGADVLRGGAGNDVIYGGSGFNQMDGQTGDDVIHGGADGDQIDGGYGTDEIFGGGGSDYITSTRGSDLLDGGDDFDTFFINRGSLTVETVTALGGAGNDRFDLYSYGGSTLIVDGGADSDIVYAHVLAGLAQVTLGTGADRLVLSQFQVGYLAYSGSIVVSDFDPAAGDVLDLDDFASFAFAEWDGSENPFGAGYARLVQNGGDTLLQIDTSGTSTYWRTVVTFQNVAPAAFTAASLSGFAPDGSPPPGQTIVGTPGFDSLQGGGGGDTIDGLDGQDWIEGLGGNDLLRGGLGGDQLFGGTGNDRLEGGDGDDDLDDGSGNDLVFGGEGNDSVNNHRGSDTVDAGAGDDHLSLQRNRSVGDVVAMFAGEGNDTLWLTLYNSAAATIDMGAGDDKVELGPVNGSLSLTLGTGADVVTIPGIAAFYHTGYVELTDFNPAFDSIFMPHFLEAYLEGWDPATNPFATGYARLVQSGADTLVQFDTNGGGDGYSTRLTLLGVHVQTLGAASIGHDVRALFGAGSDETFTFTSPASLAGVTFDGGGGTDRLVLNGQFGSGVAFGPGTFLNMERIELTSAPAGGFNGYDITVANGNLAPNALLTVAGSGLRAGETLVFHGEAATAGRFAVTGGAGDDVIFGGAGNDLLDGGSGADSMRGGTGHDTYVVDNAGDVVEENAGEGSDAVRTSLAVYSLAALPNIEALIGTSASGQTLTGNAASNRIEGAGGNDVIHAWAGGGGDTVLGNGGNDTFFFAAAFTAADTVRGGAGIDTFVIQG
ncbi:MAG TPA: calcium-binding protein, partial [Allosphingosinicella sp.]|nr:calcium-binding protein [Allosphingosinicella sp.]